MCMGPFKLVNTNMFPYVYKSLDKKTISPHILYVHGTIQVGQHKYVPKGACSVIMPSRPRRGLEGKTTPRPHDNKVLAP